MPAFDIPSSVIPGDDCGLWLDPNDLRCLDAPNPGEPTWEAYSAVSLASSILWALSGRVWGPSCPVTVRPCHRSWCEIPSRGGATQTAGVWPCGRLGKDLDLQPLGAVYDILSVMVDGALFVDWRLDEGRILRRTDGERWPTYQDLDLELDAEGTFGVTYRPGRTLNAAASVVAGIYSCEFYKALNADKSCRLPRRTRQVVRQSVTIDLVDPMEYLDKGRTGVPEVDMWLRTVNPAGLSQPSRAYSVDRRPPRGTG